MVDTNENALIIYLQAHVRVHDQKNGVKGLVNHSNMERISGLS